MNALRSPLGPGVVESIHPKRTTEDYEMCTRSLCLGGALPSRRAIMAEPISLGFPYALQ